MKWKNKTRRTKHYDKEQKCFVIDNTLGYSFMPSLVVKDHSNPNTNEWRGSGNAGQILERYTGCGAPSIGANYTCFKCQQAFKGTTICPNCKAETTTLPFTIRVPRKGRKRAWKALEIKMAKFINKPKTP